MMIQFVSLVETKTTVDIPSGEGSDGGNRLQTVHEHEAERLGLHEGEGRGSAAGDPEAAAIGGAPTAPQRKKHLPPPIGRTPAGSRLAGSHGSRARGASLPPPHVPGLKAGQQQLRRWRLAFVHGAP